MRLQLSTVNVGDVLTLCYSDDGKPVPFTAIVRQITPRGGVLLIAKYEAGPALELEIEIWVPASWSLNHVRSSRNSWWLPAAKQEQISVTKLKRLVCGK